MQSIQNRMGMNGQEIRKRDEWAERRRLVGSVGISSSKPRTRLDTASVNQPKSNSIAYYALPSPTLKKITFLAAAGVSGINIIETVRRQRDAPQITDVPIFFSSFTTNHRTRRWR